MKTIGRVKIPPAPFFKGGALFLPIRMRLKNYYTYKTNGSARDPTDLIELSVEIGKAAPW